MSMSSLIIRLRLLLHVTVAWTFAFILPTHCLAQNPIGPGGSWKLLWHDEFNGKSVDTSKWDFAYRWGQTNNPDTEPQVYEPWDVSEGDGNLILEAQVQQQSYNGKSYQYTSGMVSAKPKYDMTFGCVEARLKCPAGAGLWPAFWMIYVPAKPYEEIDMLELLGYDPTIAHCGCHLPALSARLADVTGTWTQSFHVYTLDWEPTYIREYIDGKVIGEYTDAANIAGEPLTIIFNLALANPGSWANETSSISASFPSSMQIDYVRVWKKKP
jgi:beta-glucanase (GH16 family)